MTKKVYLAGPGVFRPDAIEYGNALKAKCAALGLVGLYPFDNEIECDSEADRARFIKAANKKAIRLADAVIADLSPFRGPSGDIGTAWEMGYGDALGKLVVGYSCSLNTTYLRRCRQHNLCPTREPTVRPVDLADMAIEDFGLTDNLQVVADVPFFNNFDEALAYVKQALEA